MEKQTMEKLPPERRRWIAAYLEQRLRSDDRTTLPGLALISDDSRRASRPPNQTCLRLSRPEAGVPFCDAKHLRDDRRRMAASRRGYRRLVPRG